MKLYFLLRPGAIDPSREDYYGAKGQVVEEVGVSMYRLLSPRPNQSKGDFYLRGQDVKTS
jgi:hypothetical protein